MLAIQSAKELDVFIYSGFIIEENSGELFEKAILFSSIIQCENYFLTTEGMLVLFCTLERTASDLNLSHAINFSKGIACTISSSKILSCHEVQAISVVKTKIEFSSFIWCKSVLKIGFILNYYTTKY